MTVPAVEGDTRSAPILLVADPDSDLIRQLAAALQPDAVLISASLPIIGPLDFVRAVRLARAVPVLLGIDFGSDAEQAVHALAAGATACVARPYRVPELLPLVQAAFRRQEADRAVLTIGNVELDVTAYQVKVDGKIVHLPLREFELLHYLMRNADRTVTREQIMRNVWHSADTMSTNTIAVHVKRLRARLGDVDDKMLQTVRGVGYRLVSTT
ncbi:winged helix-turn-helix transcriptional regulator [Microtetraspora niveoalba]|uniref:winged helix-turn-helix transcriptional regulator n=1 Tax=Microtetraspora niveoalba TaxID=46175 RepID=UPI000A0267B4|nr:response regulator transcription factor [Microtetraspora niveoalba]